MDARTYRAACRLFHKACALPARERDAYLAEQCHGNEELLALVQDLLANDPGIRSGTETAHRAD